ncbi:Clavaminate synthase-like protein [Hysterangium stoloniferum]|nr:Clavaminate synthase-like protein [Hysterangium stoloniferum]
MDIDSPVNELPPFPDDVPTHPLLVIDYEKLKNDDASEADIFWKACTSLGFFYLKNHGVAPQPMWDIGKVTMALPFDEKMKYEQGDSGCSFGYKAAGANNTDEYGSLDTVEFMNVSKDDALGRPEIIHRVYPPCIESSMSTIKEFITTSDDINRTLMDIMSDRLGLPREILRQKHDSNEHSGSESRIIRNPPKAITKDHVGIGAHTDFGSLSILHHNVLGGLQVLVPGTQTWQYIKPLPGHAICNIGDSLSVYSGGILRSNLHRVVPAPGLQSQFYRWSLVYFLRPATSAIMAPLIQSPLIADASEKKPMDIGEDVTAGEWFARRIRNQRVANRTGPETWRASRGTEHAPNVV